MSDKAAGQKARSPEGCDENGPAAALLLSHVSIQICSFVAPCRRPILIATPLHQSLTCTLAKIHQCPTVSHHSIPLPQTGMLFAHRIHGVGSVVGEWGPIAIDLGRPTLPSRIAAGSTIACSLSSPIDSCTVAGSNTCRGWSRNPSTCSATTLLLME